MAKKTSAPKTKTKTGPSSSKLPVHRLPQEDDGILDSDSEEDELANYKSVSRGGNDSEDEDDEEDDEDDDEEPDSDDVPGDYDSDEGDGVGAWEPDEWDGAEPVSSDEEESGEEAQVRKLQKGLKDIPLATVMKAQRAMKSKREAAADSEDEDDGLTPKERKLAAAKAKLAMMQKAKGKAANVVVDAGRDESGDESGSGSGSDDGKRSSKHAPTVMSTKRQVSRARQVIAVPKRMSRDPRFGTMSTSRTTADVDASRYAFVPELLKEELANLRKAVAVASKAEKHCKLVEKPRYTAERERLEDEMGRVRTRLERAERERRDREVLSAAKRDEREKRESGKGAWYMKKSEKRDLLLKARFEALEQAGGKGAVKKAMDKKLKKVAAKEKKSRPFAAGGGGGGGEAGGKRRRVA